MLSRRLFASLMPFVIIVAVGVLFISAKKFMIGQEGCNCVNLETATGEFEPNAGNAVFNGQYLSASLASIPGSDLNKQILGEQSSAVQNNNENEKWIEVDLSEQKLRAWEGDKLFLESLISSGKYVPTPTGEFRIWIKFHYARMQGGVKGTGSYYNLPNVPYIMYFHKGFGLHGTYWHNNFGQPMSHGCVNLPTPVAEQLYYWTTPIIPAGAHQVRSTTDNQGTRVVIHQ